MIDKIKLAAIKLKGIATADREWVLNRLTESERSKLDPILAQLDYISFEQVLGLDELVESENALANQPNAVLASLKTSSSVEVNAMSKLLARHSDEFLSLLLDPRVDDDQFLSLAMESARYSRILELSKKRMRDFSPRLANVIRNQLIASVGSNRNG